MASDTQDPLSIEADEVERRLSERGIAKLSYYNGDTHRGLFALPNYYRDLVG